MIKSRLQLRRNTITVAVKVKTLTGGTTAPFTEANVSGLSAVPFTLESVDAFEVTTEGGMVVTVTDVLFHEALAGASLPAIEEKHVLVDTTSSVRYEVLQAIAQGGEQDRLMVRTRRLR